MNNSSAVKVGDIYREAGVAFQKLSEMTLLLHPSGEAQPGGKWTEQEMQMLRSCVHRFAVDLNKLSQQIKERNVSQIRTTLKKEFEDAGMRNEVVRQVSSPAASAIPAALQVHQAPLSAFNPAVIGNNAEVTLNMLNATENEVEALGNDVKLEFEATGEEVT